jgi:hypothetical protein
MEVVSVIVWWVAVIIAAVAGFLGGVIGGEWVADHRDELSTDLIKGWEDFVHTLELPDTQRLLETADRAATDIDLALTDINVLAWSTTVLGALLTATGFFLGLAGPSMTTWIANAQWPQGAASWIPVVPLRAALVILSVAGVVLTGGLLATGPVDKLIRAIDRPGRRKRRGLPMTP